MERVRASLTAARLPRLENDQTSSAAGRGKVSWGDEVVEPCSRSGAGGLETGTGNVRRRLQSWPAELSVPWTRELENLGKQSLKACLSDPCPGPARCSCPLQKETLLPSPSDASPGSVPSLPVRGSKESSRIESRKHQDGSSPVRSTWPFSSAPCELRL